MLRRGAPAARAAACQHRDRGTWCRRDCAARLIRLVEPTTGIEPVTPSLPRKCSTTEPRGPENPWSGKRDSNPRPSAWKADALPLSYSRADRDRLGRTPRRSWTLASAGEPPVRPRAGGERRIRTSEALRRQIYSLLPLTARESPHDPRPPLVPRRQAEPRPPRVWSWRRDLNPRPADYKSAALPAELRQLGKRQMLA